MYAIMFKLDILQIYNIKSYRQKCKDVLDSEQVQYSIDVMTAYRGNLFIAYKIIFI